MPRRFRPTPARRAWDLVEDVFPWILGVALCLAPVLGWLWLGAGMGGDRALNRDPTVQVIDGPRPEACGRMRDTGEPLGPVFAVLGRGQDTLMYRFRQYSTATRYVSRASLFDVPAGEVRIEPCGTVRVRL